MQVPDIKIIKFDHIHLMYQDVEKFGLNASEYTSIYVLTMDTFDSINKNGMNVGLKF